MKKALSMLLAVIMVLTLMVGCGDKNNNDKPDTKTYPESFAGMEDISSLPLRPKVSSPFTAAARKSIFPLPAIPLRRSLVSR